ncbi:MAG TPA: thioredoxin domain-containing protein [Candidatus Saccharimonadales bacterium]|jgi:protein-disulfide isomerase|nr:thioredoxin domain-containing protein [Candidatus Saccharimonadales bacterium]
MKKLLAFFLLAAIAVCAQAQKKTDPASPTGQSILLPGNAEIETALQRTFGYDPGVSWQILDIRPSGISGVADVVLSINKQAAQHLYLSSDTQNAIVGELIPFGANPFAPARAKLLPADGPARGPEKPAITIVEFSDLQCPHCKTAQPVIEKLVTDFPQIKFIFQQFPLPASLHPWALKAALYADCAGKMSNDGFWKYINSVFENQGSIALATADDKLKELATGAGLDAAKLSACAAGPEADARVKKSMDLGQVLEVTSTPTVFVNGRRIQAIGSIPYDQLKALVKFEVDHAGK